MFLLALSNRVHDLNGVKLPTKKYQYSNQYSTVTKHAAICFNQYQDCKFPAMISFSIITCFVSPAKLDAMPVRIFTCVVVKYAVRDYTLSEKQAAFLKMTVQEYSVLNIQRNRLTNSEP